VLDQPDLAIAAQLAQFARDLHDTDGGVDQAVTVVLEFAAKTLACPFAGVALTRRAGRVDLAGVTDPLIELLCRLSLTGDGPLLEVSRGGKAVVVDYTELDRPEGAADEALAAEEAGVRTAVHLPLTVGTGPVGALSLFSPEPIDVSSRWFTLAELIGQHSAIAIAVARHSESMALAVEARKVVGEAVGILMQRFGISADTAFQVLDRHSQHTNTKLRTVARYVREHRRLPDVPE
jgi:GAF domain-containing protein